MCGSGETLCLLHSERVGKAIDLSPVSGILCILPSMWLSLQWEISQSPSLTHYYLKISHWALSGKSQELRDLGSF